MCHQECVEPCASHSFTSPCQHEYESSSILTHLNKNQIYKSKARALKSKNKVIVAIDLAGKPKNPTGWTLWKSKKVETRLIHTNKEILDGIAHGTPAIVAIDAPFSLPKKGILRIADREMIRRGYRVLPPCLPAMKTLTLRAMKLNKMMVKKGMPNNRGAPYINT